MSVSNTSGATAPKASAPGSTGTDFAASRSAATGGSRPKAVTARAARAESMVSKAERDPKGWLLRLQAGVYRIGSWIKMVPSWSTQFPMRTTYNFMKEITDVYFKTKSETLKAMIMHQWRVYVPALRIQTILHNVNKKFQPNVNNATVPTAEPNFRAQRPNIAYNIRLMADRIAQALRGWQYTYQDPPKK